MKTLFVISMMLMTMIPGEKSVYDFKVKNIDGKEVSLAQYKGKVLLFVNVASMCGNTPQYKDIENLYKKYSDFPNSQSNKTTRFDLHKFVNLDFTDVDTDE